MVSAVPDEIEALDGLLHVQFRFAFSGLLAVAGGTVPLAAAVDDELRGLPSDSLVVGYIPLVQCLTLHCVRLDRK